MTGRTYFYGDVVPLDITGIGQSLPEYCHKVLNRAGRAPAEKADHQHRLLLACEVSGRTTALPIRMMNSRRLTRPPTTVIPPEYQISRVTYTQCCVAMGVCQ